MKFKTLQALVYFISLAHARAHVPNNTKILDRIEADDIEMMGGVKCTGAHVVTDA